MSLLISGSKVRALVRPPNEIKYLVRLALKLENIVSVSAIAMQDEELPGP
jgi:hypothetical protein